jgi:hypothetical protein
MEVQIGGVWACCNPPMHLAPMREALTLSPRSGLPGTKAGTAFCVDKLWCKPCFSLLAGQGRGTFLHAPYPNKQQHLVTQSTGHSHATARRTHPKPGLRRCRCLKESWCCQPRAQLPCFQAQHRRPRLPPGPRAWPIGQRASCQTPPPDVCANEPAARSPQWGRYVMLGALSACTTRCHVGPQMHTSPCTTSLCPWRHNLMSPAAIAHPPAWSRWHVLRTTQTHRVANAHKPRPAAQLFHNLPQPWLHPVRRPHHPCGEGPRQHRHRGMLCGLQAGRAGQLNGPLKTRRTQHHPIVPTTPTTPPAAPPHRAPRHAPPESRHPPGARVEGAARLPDIQGGWRHEA